MKLAVLFWFYKEIAVCENHLQILKKNNPDLKVFGLYGGKQEHAQKYRNKLGRYLDDFYTYPLDKTNDWKWVNGDLMILDWYEKRGRNLDWDSVAVIQWDALVFDSIANQLQGIKKGQIFLSGLKPIDEETENNWDWTSPEGRHRQNYLSFLKYVKENYGYKDQPLSCLFILEIFPKEFFDRYLMVEDKKIGMLEYKIPIYAKIFDIPFFKKEIGVKWSEEDEKPLDAEQREVRKDFIEEELNKKDGWRIFHPYWHVWDE